MLDRLLEKTYMVRLNSFQTAIQGITLAGAFTKQPGSYCTMSNTCFEEPQWNKYGSAAASCAVKEFSDASGRCSTSHSKQVFKN